MQTIKLQKLLEKTDNPFFDNKIQEIFSTLATNTDPMLGQIIQSGEIDCEEFSHFTKSLTFQQQKTINEIKEILALNMELFNKVKNKEKINFKEISTSAINPKVLFMIFKSLSLRECLHAIKNHHFPQLNIYHKNTILNKCQNLSECQQVLKLFPNTLDNEVTKATILNKCQNLSECQQVLKLFPNTLDNEVTKNTVLNKCQNLSECQQVLKLFPNTLDDEVTKNTILNKCQSLSECQQVLKLFPNTLDDEVTKATILNKCQNLSECQQVLKLFPNTLDDEVTKNTILNKCQNLSECQQVLKLFPNTPDNEVTYFIISRIHIENKSFEKANEFINHVGGRQKVYLEIKKSLLIPKIDDAVSIYMETMTNNTLTIEDKGVIILLSIMILGHIPENHKDYSQIVSILRLYFDDKQIIETIKEKANNYEVEFATYEKDYLRNNLFRNKIQTEYTTPVDKQARTTTYFSDIRESQK